jgi:hypothetical protein
MHCLLCFVFTFLHLVKQRIKMSRTRITNSMQKAVSSATLAPSDETDRNLMNCAKKSFNEMEIAMTEVEEVGSELLESTMDELSKVLF